MKIVFTSSAFIEAIEQYGSLIFEWEHDIFTSSHFIVEDKNILGSQKLSTITGEIIKKNWLKINFINKYVHGYDELDGIAEFDSVFPDEIIVIVSSVRELYHLNRTYGIDSLKSVSELCELF